MSHRKRPSKQYPVEPALAEILREHRQRMLREQARVAAWQAMQSIRRLRYHLVHLVADMVTIDNVRQVAMSLPRTEEHVVRGRVKFRVGKIVYVAFSRDEKILGFAFPKEWRAALIEAAPDKFHMPEPADVRYNWVCVRRSAIDHAEMRKLVTEAWRMVVPKSVAAGHLDASGSRR